jgi:nitric-oxide synthase, bacterial
VVVTTHDDDRSTAPRQQQDFFRHGGRMARGMATMVVSGSPAEAEVSAGVPSPAPSSVDARSDHGEPTLPLAAPVPGAAAVPAPTVSTPTVATATAPPAKSASVDPWPGALSPAVSPDGQDRAADAGQDDRPRPRPRPRPAPASSGPASSSGPDTGRDEAGDAADEAPEAEEPTAARVPAARAPSGTITTPSSPVAAQAGAAPAAGTVAAGTVAPVDPAEATEFLRLFYAEADEPGAPTVKGAASRPVPHEERLAAVLDEIERTGTYVHTSAELTFGARVAWRNSARCIGRLYWRSLHVRDRRGAVEPDEVAAECVGHLDDATRRGRIRSTITVFAPDTPTSPGPRVWNEQLIRYAGYRTGGRVLGDPRYVGFTDHARSLGWTPPSPMGRFDVLPLVVSGGGEWAEKGPQVFDVPSSSVLEVDLAHPDHEWFAELGLRWHALPVISNMRLDIGGVSYPAAPFNGWYMATEIGARNLADSERYDMLGEVAERMGLDTSTDRTMWRDRAAVELTLAVQHSFDRAGVSMADHHGESQRFLRHLEREEGAGRRCPVDWSWIVPPISGGLTPVFHRYYDQPTDSGPMFRLDDQAAARGQGCPM